MIYIHIYTNQATPKVCLNNLFVAVSMTFCSWKHCQLCRSYIILLGNKQHIQHIFYIDY